jgi:CBS domain containing-hemolysin-like protein
MIVFLLVMAALLSLALAALCAGAETGYLSVSRERILHLAREGGRKAALVQKAIGDISRTMTMLLIGNNLASVTYSASTAALSAALFAEGSVASLVWSFFAAFTVLYVSEFMPKLLFAARPLRRILSVADAIKVMALALSPLTSVAMKFTDMFMPSKEQKYRLTSADLLRILQDRKDGVCLSDLESALITRIIVLRVKGKPITPEAILSALR